MSADEKELGASPQVPAPFEPSHTPLPWAQSHRQTGPESWCTEVYDSEGGTIATLAWYPVETAEGITTSRGANAAFIVLSANAHHGLVSLLRRWTALDGGAWHVERQSADKADLLAETRAALKLTEI